MDGLVCFFKNHPFGAAVGSIILINQGALMITNNGLNQCSDRYPAQQPTSNTYFRLYAMGLQKRRNFFHKYFNYL